MAIAELLVKLKDQASSGIGRIGEAFRGLGDRARDAGGDTKGLTASFRDALLQVNAMEFALNKASQAFGFLNGKFEEAKNLQLEQINAASTFSALTGQSYEEAAKFIEDFNSRLAKSASTLPGSTQEYKNLALSVQDDVLEAFKDPAGTLNQKGFEDALASISESYGALTAASTRDFGNTSLGLSKALGGASIAELRGIAFFEQNKKILVEIEKQLSSQGKELKDLSIAERVKLIQDAGAKFITDEFKTQAATSVDGLLQNLSSVLFDPSAGIFGIMKDFDPDTDGAQSAFSAINDALNELIGSNGVFFQVGGLLSDAGLTMPQPMLVLRNGIMFFVSGLKRINEGLIFARDFIKAGGDAVDAFSVGLSRVINPDLLNPQAIASGLTDFMGSIAERIRVFVGGLADLAAPLFNQGVGIISRFFEDKAQLREIGIAFGSMIGRVAGGVAEFLGQVNYSQLLVGIGNVAIGLGHIVVGAAGGLIVATGEGIWNGIQSLAPSVMAGIGNVIDSLQQTIVDGVMWSGNLLKGIVGRIPGIGKFLAGVIDFQAGALKSLIESGVSGLIRYIKDAFMGLIDGIRERLTGLVNQARQLPGIGALIPGGSPPTAQPMAIGSRYGGQIETASNGFLGNLLNAARAELANMPGGARLVLANSSETILPSGVFSDLIRNVAGMSAPAAQMIPVPIPASVPAQPTPTPVAALPAPVQQGGQVTNQNTFNISIQASDLRDVASQAIGEIQAIFENELKASFG